MPLVETAPRIKANGADLAPEWLDTLISLRIDRPIGIVGRATLRFRDPGYELTTRGLLKVGTEVAVSDPSGDQDLFVGNVSGIGVEQSGDGDAVPELTVTVDDAAYALARSSNVKSYIKQKISDVLIDIAGRNGLRPQVTATSAQVPYLMQTGTDLAFLDDLVRRCGMVWWVAPAAPKTLRVAKPDADARQVAELRLGEDLLRFSVRASGLPPSEVEVTAWDRATKKTIKGVSTNPPPATDKSELLRTVSAEGKKLNGQKKFRVADTLSATKEEADVIAASLFAEARSASVAVKGTTFANGAIDIGKTVKVEGAGPTGGTFLVTGVEHVYDRRGFYTTFTAGPHRPVGLVDTLGPPAESGTTFHGMVIGIVTNNNDPESLGRVKVKFAGVDDQLESDWARVVTLGGGEQRGILFLPEVNDEVLVGFERGDTRAPVVLGGLFGSKAKTPGTAPPVANAKVEHRRITSRVGHVLELSDAAGKEHVLLQLGGSNPSHRLRIGHDRIDLEIAKGKPIKIGNGTASIELAANGDVIIKGAKVVIESTGTTDLKATGALSAKSTTGAAQVEGMTAVVKGQASAEVSAGGAVTVKGATVAIN
jgi:uncharacterized protein involved in type VI secretion and phage assembly